MGTEFASGFFFAINLGGFTEGMIMGCLKKEP